MKKLLLATAIAALSVSAAQAAPTVYGKAFVTADYVDVDADLSVVETGSPDIRLNGSEDTVQVNSNSSRIGVKGSEAMTANTDVIYQLEYGVNIDSGAEKQFTSRDTYLGLNNKTFGQFRAGRNMSVLDYVNNVIVTHAYWDNLGAGSAADVLTAIDDENEQDLVDALTTGFNMTDSSRQDNSIVWIAPKYNGVPVELALQYSADERLGESDHGFGASLLFDQGTGFTAGLAYTKDMDTRISYDDETIGGNIIRGTATVDLGKYIAAPVTLGALYQVADYDYEDAKKEKGLVVSAEMGLTNFARPASIYAQYNKTDNLSGVNNFDSDQIVVGGKYMFKDNLIAHAYVGQNSADYAYSEVVGSYSYKERADVDNFALGGGLEYLF
ncbi:porin [Psychrobacter sp. DWR1-2-3]|uniref:porin n=1 Tax=Psychrobacter sp. DWR1-2-3 TaxID=2804637 RepID=UPI003CED0D44